MRAWAVVENGKPLKEIELPTPEPTGTEVLLEVTHCGVWHSDLHIWEGYYDIGGGQRMSLKRRGRQAVGPKGPCRAPAARHRPRDRRPSREAGAGREGSETRRPAHRLPLAG